MDDLVQLKFVKNDQYWNEYFIMFLNPSYNQWWYLPKGNAGIHKPWSLTEYGSCGPYNHQRLVCQHSEINYYKKRFKNLGNIHIYLLQFKKQYEDFELKQKKDDELPKEIY